MVEVNAETLEHLKPRFKTNAGIESCLAIFSFKPNKMIKKDIINRIEMETGMDPKICSVALETVIEAVKESLTNGKPLYIRGLGTFKVIWRKQKKVQNFQTGETIIMKAFKKPVFKPSKQLIARINDK